MERKNPVNLRLSDAALDLIAEEEGWIPYAYDDADKKALKTFVTEDNAHFVKGTLTIGHGHTRTVKPGMRITPEEGRSLLRSDVRDAESCVHRYVHVPLTQNEFDAMVDPFFNVGPGSLPNQHYPNGKDGIACLGKSGGGRPSTLLTVLNNGDYEAAARCFTQWRMPGSIFEWGLLKRRIRFMLMFMGLPITRAANAFPNAIPQGDVARADFVAGCIARAKEELEDILVLHPEIPTPQPPPKAPVSASSPGGEDELILTDPIVIPPRPEAAPDVATRDVGAGPVAVASPSGPAAPPPAKPVPATEAAAPVKEAGSRPVPVSPGAVPAPPAGVSRPAAPPVGTKPIHPDTKMPEHVPYRIDPHAGLKPMESTERFVGAALMFVGTFLRVGMANGMKLSGVGGIMVVALLDFMKSPTNLAIVVSVIAILITGSIWTVGFCMDKYGLRKKKRGERSAVQGMY